MNKELLKEELLSGRVKDETTLAVFTMVQELKTDIEELRGEVDNAVDKVKESEIDLPKVLESVRGTKGEQGVQGDVGEKGDIGENGKDGKDGVSGKDGLNGINGVDGLNGGDGIDGKDGKDGSPDTPQQTRDKLESLKDGEKLSIQAIQDLAKILEELKGGISQTSSRVATSLISKRIRFIDDQTLTGTKDAVNTVFTISKSPETGSLKIYRGGARQRVGEDYTLSAGDKTITFTLAPQATEILLADFRF